MLGTHVLISQTALLCAPCPALRACEKQCANLLTIAILVEQRKGLLELRNLLLSELLAAGHGVSLLEVNFCECHD